MTCFCKFNLLTISALNLLLTFSCKTKDENLLADVISTLTCEPKLEGAADAQLKEINENLKFLCLNRQRIWKKSRFGEFPIYFSHLSSTDLKIFTFGNQVKNDLSIVKSHLPDIHNGSTYSLFKFEDMFETVLVIERDIAAITSLLDRVGVKDKELRSRAVKSSGIASLAFHEHMHWKLQSIGDGSLGIWKGDLPGYQDEDIHVEGDWSKVDQLMATISNAAQATGDSRMTFLREAKQIRNSLPRYADSRERYEGIAHFSEHYAFSMLSNDKSSKEEAILNSIIARLTIKSSLETASDIRAQYYLIGALACVILRDLQPNRSWEDLIEKGHSPTSLLFGILD